MASEMGAWERSSYELGRRTGSVVTPAELARMTGRRVRTLSRAEYEFREGGRVAPPVRLVVECEPAALDGVTRSVSKLLESRGWTASASVSKVTEVMGDGDGDR